MPGDNLRKVVSGERLNISAEAWNAFVDAARAAKRLGGQGGQAVPSTAGEAAVVVVVKNVSGGVMAANKPAAITACLITPTANANEFLRRPMFEVDAPASADDWVVVPIGPLDVGAIGRAVVVGAVACYVDVSDAGHTRAAPSGSSANLVSGSDAGYPILWKESGTGTGKLAYVLLGGDRGGGSIDDATVSVRGAVNTDTQSFAGTKSFGYAVGGMSFVPGVVVAGEASNPQTTGQPFTVFDELITNSKLTIGFETVGGYNYVRILGESPESFGGGGACILLSDGAIQFRDYSAGGITTDAPTLWVGTLDGKNGTYGGLQFTSGLLTGGSLAVSGSSITTGTIGIGVGGTGVTTTPTNGQLLIGNGTGYTLATLTAGSHVTITNGAGSITVAALASVTSGRLIGRSTAGAGAAEEITIGSGLSLSGGTLSATGTSYTDEQAQDAVGGILTDTATINFTYNDAGNQITADLIDESVTNAKIADNTIQSGKLAVTSGARLLGRKASTSGPGEEISCVAPLFLESGLHVWREVPLSNTAAGVAGEMAYDSDYVYVCVSTNTWKRLAFVTGGGASWDLSP